LKERRKRKTVTYPSPNGAQRRVTSFIRG